MPEYQAMFKAIKIRLVNQVGNLVKSSGVQQYSTQHGLLCLDRIRGQLDRLKLGVSYWNGKVLHEAG